MRLLTPALAASGALGLKLLMTVGPASAQDADRSIPCDDGMAGVYACDRVDLLGRLSREQLGAADTVKLNDVWGWTDPRDDREYALVGRMDGTAFVDVTDKGNPVAVAHASYPVIGYAHQGWLTDDHRHFYMGDELDEASGWVDGQRTLIWDMTDLDEPILLAEHIGPNDDPEHNLYVRGDRLYLALKRSGLRVLDIADRTNPVEVGYFDTTPADPSGADTIPADAGTLARAAGFDGAWSVYPFFESGNVLVSGRSEGLFVVRLHAYR